MFIKDFLSSSKAFSKVNDEKVIIWFFLIFLSFIFLLFLKKIYYKFFKKQNYQIIPKLEISQISNIAMIIAMNIALIITIGLLSHKLVGIFFNIYPGVRFVIENVLIKIGGILFGPLIGIYIALMTDLLTVIFTSSVLHYGYLFSAVMNGFIGGIIHLLINMKKDNKKIIRTIFVFVIQILSLAFLCYLFTANSNATGNLSVKLLSMGVAVHWSWLFFYISAIFLVIFFFLIFSVFCVNLKTKPEFENNKWVNKFAELNTFFMILSVNFSAYIFIDVTALPLFDIKISSLPYEQFLIFRLLTLLPMLLISTIFIWFIFNLHGKIKVNENSNTEDIIQKNKSDKKINLNKSFMYRKAKGNICVH